jgi:hypothetical protein
MKTQKQVTTKPTRGIIASKFYQMLAMLSISQALEKSENIEVTNPVQGFRSSGISGWGYFPTKHPIKSYAKQRREAQKRRNIAARSKH